MNVEMGERLNAPHGHITTPLCPALDWRAKQSDSAQPLHSGGCAPGDVVRRVLRPMVARAPNAQVV